MCWTEDSSEATRMRSTQTTVDDKRANIAGGVGFLAERGERASAVCVGKRVERLDIDHGRFKLARGGAKSEQVTRPRVG